MRAGVSWLILVSACAGVGQTSPMMTELEKPMAGPPSGQVLVVFHYHEFWDAEYTRLWDEKTFIGVIGHGQAVYYVCKPGKRRFVARFPQVVGVMEADLLPGKTYDVHLVGRFRGLEPADPEDVTRWNEELRPLVLNQEIARGDKVTEADFERIIFDFTEGKKKDRLAKLPADAHR